MKKTGFSLESMTIEALGNPMMPISVIADVLKVHQRTLRIYDEENLLSPCRSTKNRRLYSMIDIQRGKCIQFLTKELGINLAGIKIIFKLLEQQGIPFENHQEHVLKLALSLGISSQMQAENRLKLSKRGRKPKAIV